MKYSRNAVYNRIVEAITDGFPRAYCTGRYVPKPPSFPACYIHEIDRNRPIQYTQLDFADEQWESVFEVQIASDKQNTAMTEANAIMDIVRGAFSALYYREFSEVSIDQGHQYTIIGRFRRVIGGGDTMPTAQEDEGDEVSLLQS